MVTEFQSAHAREADALQLAALKLAAQFFAGVWLYCRATRPADRVGTWALAGLVAFLVVIHIGNIFGPPPPSAGAIAWVGHAQWLFVIRGFWVDRHRRAKGNAVLLPA